MTTIGIVSFLIKYLGPTLTRAVFTRLFRDEITGSDLAETLAESLDVGGLAEKWLGSDVVAQRQAVRFFDEMGDQAATSLAHLFSESDMSIGERDVLLPAIAQTLEQHALPLLLQNDLQLKGFQTALLSVPIPDSVHVYERELYKEMLRQCGHVIFAFADQLPQFQQGAAAETLRRLTGVQGSLATIGEQVAQIYAVSQKHNPDEVAAQFEQRYRQELAVQLDRLEWFGVPGMRHMAHALDISYVTLKMSRAEKLEPSSYHDERQKVMDAAEALTQSRRLLIAGRAGSGKTTLLKWVAVRAARQNFPHEELKMWQEKLPVFLRLRDFANKPLPKVEELPLTTSAGRPPQNWFIAQMSAGRVVLLVDGLDEVTEAQRDAAYAWLESLIALYQDVIYIVSTRPYTLDENQAGERLGRSDFMSVHLRDLDPEGTAELLTRWHNALAEAEKHLPAAERADTVQLAQSLQAQLTRQKPLQDLARNPLLAAMLCLLHYRQRQQLPQDRIQLYDDCLRLLLEARDVERQVDTGDYGELPGLRRKIRLVQALAYWMMRNDEPVMPIAQAESILADMGYTDGRVLRFLLERSGLLQKQSAESFDFAHRTFQEYLAAGALLYQGDWGILGQNAARPEWQETVRLLGGVAKTLDHQKALLDRLWQTAEKEQMDEPEPLHLLALEAFSLMAEPDPVVRELVAQHAQKLIETEEAASDNGKNLQTLSLDGTAVSDLTPLANLTQLQALSLGNTAVDNLTPLANLTQLRLLNLNDTAVSDLTLLANLTQLQRLNLWGTDVSDLTPLANLTQLQVLFMNKTGVRDLTPLAELTQLQELYLTDSAVSDLTPLSGLTQLQGLNFGGTEVSDLSPLMNLTQLKTLYFGDTDIRDLSPLANLTQLQNLSFGGTEVSDLGPLKDLLQLQELYLYETKVSDLSPLTNLTQLQELNFGGTEVSDLDPLANLTQLKELFLWGTEVNDLTALVNLTQLHVLGLQGTGVSNLTPLANLTQLQMLDLEKTVVSDLAPLVDLAQLQVLDLRITAESIDFLPLTALPALKAVWLTEEQNVPDSLKENVRISPLENPYLFWQQLQHHKIPD
ncbi:MAG: NACHT domain-containing protein [Anaerolineaceae bacterium]|nr:NACHT domain-containing protein [Anaerolineaceae bacterium]